MPRKSKAKTSTKGLSNIKSGSEHGGRKRRKENYSIYIYRVMKQVLPTMSISAKAMSIMDSFVNDLFERIATEAGRIAKNNRKSTITSREIQTAVRLIVPGELAKHAVSEGLKAGSKDMEMYRLIPQQPTFYGKTLLK